jgi:hypothetical protein
MRRSCSIATAVLPQAMRRSGTIATLLLLITHGLLMQSASAQTGTSEWLRRAAALQNYMAYDTVPLQFYPFLSTHNSFSSDETPATHSTFEVQTNQRYNLTQQLSCLAVRGLEIDVHYVTALGTSKQDPQAIKVCHTGPQASQKVYSVCENLGWEICNSCGVENFGPEATGCKRSVYVLNMFLFIC